MGSSTPLAVLMGVFGVVVGSETTVHKVGALSPFGHCTIHVSTTGSDQNNGSLPSPLRTPAFAKVLRRSGSFKSRCPGQATILLGPGTFYIASPPLVLTQNDSATTWIGSAANTSVLSAGQRIADSCWTNVNATPDVWRCPIGTGRLFKSITVEGQRLRLSRWPKYDPQNPHSGGWLFVNSSYFLGNGTFVIGVDVSTIPSSVLSDIFQATLHIFPKRSWINIVGISIAPVSQNIVNNSLYQNYGTIQHFSVQCPGEGLYLCTNTSNSATISAGNRFFIEGLQHTLSDSEWAYSSDTGDLMVYKSGGMPPTNVVVPLSTTVVSVTVVETQPTSCQFNATVKGRSPGSAISTLPPTTIEACKAACCQAIGCKAIHLDPVKCYLFDRTYEGKYINDTHGGVVADRFLPSMPPAPMPKDISFNSIAFTDTDFSYFGYQEGFSVDTNSTGMPRDAALIISQCSNVHVINCSFSELAGGGIHVTNGSTLITISGNTLHNIGQTGVALDGGLTTQPQNCSIVHNSFLNVGTTLASAAAIVGSSLSYTTISDNVIQGSPRWGIAIRSNGASISYGNTVERNRLSQLAQSTRDLGGLSFIGAGHTGTVVRYNCVRDVIGLDTDPSGRIWTPFYNWGLYLDNWSSNFTVESNIFHTNVLGGVFVHGGSNNSITNNIFFNTSNASMPDFRILPHPAGSGGMLIGEVHATQPTIPTSNIFVQNIVMMLRKNPMAVIAGTRKWATDSVGLQSDKNVFWNTMSNLSDCQFLTPLGNWESWRVSGYDEDSEIADPGFVDAQSGNFKLAADSPAIARGFNPLPDGWDQC